ncbi:MAG: hypothetical protein RJA35_697 [Actinomycetota bacterium]|jgi:glutathione peroxidase
MSKTDISGINIPLLNGSVFSTDELKGKLVLFVNVASKCGFTPQYEGLEALYKKYKDRGLAIVGLPTDQFKQEPGAEAEIAEFCTLNYGVTFPVTAKVWVNGKERHPLFEKLTKAKDGLGIAGPVLWNFEKFVVTPSGETRRFRSVTKPEDSNLVDFIEANLPN